MNSLTGSITDSIRLYADFNNYDDIETKPLLKRGKRPKTYDRIITIEDNEIIPSRIINRQSKIENDSKAPIDKYYIAALVAFFSGVTGLLPLVFFLIANDYWMYKFRDPTQPNYDLNNKTHLQTTFVSMISICTAFPSVISVFFTARCGHKLDVRNRLLLSLGFLSIMFLLFTVFIVVNTDTWQTMFFIITMTLFGISSSFHPFYGMTNLAYLSKFPAFYMELNLLGSSISGLFCTILQIVSLTVGHTSTQTAMIYFCSGTVIVIFTLFLIYIMKYSATIQYYLENGKDESNNQIYTIKEYWEVAKKIWFVLLIAVINSSTMNTGHPNITNLVVSEGYTGTGESLWYDKYFVVVATYLLYDVFQILGRLCGRTIIKEKVAIYFILFALFRSFVLTPLLWFCNAQPRSHLPVLFPHDYQYMMIQAIHSFTGSAFMAMGFLSIPVIAEEKTEQALILVMGVSTLSFTITSPLSPIYVNLL